MRFLRTAALVTALSAACAGTLMAQAAARPRAARTPHRTLNKDDCLSCHRRGANEHVTPVPAEQHDFANGSCVACHRLAATLPSRSEHAFDAAHARCAVCHVAGSPTGAQAIPATHANYHATLCVMCHEPRGAS